MRTRDLLSRGIGIHHGGLLPLVKEVRQDDHPAWRPAHSPGSACRNLICSRPCKDSFRHGDVRDGEFLFVIIACY